MHIDLLDITFGGIANINAQISFGLKLNSATHISVQTPFVQTSLEPQHSNTPINIV